MAGEEKIISFWTWHGLTFPYRVGYRERRKTKKEKRKSPQIKIH
jgi:hypothetical protein